MIFSPLSGLLDKDYRITQEFGVNPKYYVKYGLRGHNGCDLSAYIGTQLFAPFDGYVQYADEGKIGYGKYATIISDVIGINRQRRRVDLGHLSRFMNLSNGSFIHQGDPVGISGNSGDSTGPHVHITYKVLDADGKVLDYNNGYHGAIDISPYIQTWVVGQTIGRS